MLQFFLNPWMLAGLAGVTLPIIVHLLVRRRYHVVDWGAMQFLSPGLRTRRRLQLQDVALLLLRIALVAILAAALARPWFHGGLFTGYHSDGSRDVVLVIDGSVSMAQPDGITTLHQSAIRRAAAFLDSLSAADTVMLIDARDLPDVRQQTPETDRQVVREQLDNLDPPGGYSNLPAACERAASLLLQTSGRHREIIVFTDAQRASWKLDTPDVWQQLDDLLALAAVRPRLWIVDTSRDSGPNRNLISVGRLTVQPESTVPDGEVRVTTRVTNHSSATLEVPLRLLVDGQPAGSLRRLQIDAKREAGTEFVHRVSGAHVQELRIEAELPDDVLQTDNSSSAIAGTRAAPHVLLVESSDDLDVTRQRSWFATAALTPPADMPPWVRTQTVLLNQLSEDDVQSADVIILPDTGELPGECIEWLKTAVESGTGLLISVGPHSSEESFRRSFRQSGLLPNVQLTEPATADEPVRILPSSLLSDWLEPFRDRPDSSFLNAVFDSWWTIQLEGPTDPQNGDDSAATAHTVARLSNQAPLLLECRRGRGRVILLTAPLDTTWSNLPGRPDFVAFLYEAVFHLAPAVENRNQLPGQQLVTRLNDSSQTNLSIEPPSGIRVPVQSSLVGGADGTSSELRVRYDRTFVPGIYRLLSSDTDNRLDAFAVDYDRKEDSTDGLTDDDRRLLSESERMVFSDSVTALRRTMYGEESITELWWLLVLVCLSLLVLESWSTRRLVMQRYGAQNDSPEDPDPHQPAEQTSLSDH